MSQSIAGFYSPSLRPLLPAPAIARAEDPQSVGGRIVGHQRGGYLSPRRPIHDKPAFAAFTQPGKVLDPTGILVGSTSNFGAPLANAGQLPGSFLSIDPHGVAPLMIPADFAAAGDRASPESPIVWGFRSTTHSDACGLLTRQSD